jgi:ParB-like chromosome segregation protein Spo0J
VSATPIPETLVALKVPVSGLVPYGDNPRRGNIDVIIESLARHGQYRPIVVRAKTFEVLAGNHTLAAAKELGWSEIAATFVDVSDDEAARIVLVDNRAADLGTYDDEVLAQLLSSLPDLDGTGFDAEDLATLLALQDPPVRGLDLDTALAEADASAWPWVNCQLDPEVYARFRDLPGEDDQEKLTQLLVPAAPVLVERDPDLGY